MMRNLKNVFFGALALGVAGLMACGDVVLEKTKDLELQLQDDIKLIEDYLAQEGYTDYDTLETDTRVVILDEGDGEPIEYNDIIWYHYIGTLVDSLSFDTSYDTLAFNQDMSFLIDSVHVRDEDNNYPFLDVNGIQRFQSATYEGEYIGIYDYRRDYVPLRTTHTPGGWFLQQSGLVNGFKQGVHHIFERVKLGGKGLILMPSNQGYGSGGNAVIPSYSVLVFEIHPVRKK